MKFYDVVESLLKQDLRFVAENGSVLKNAVYEAAMNLDSNLIRLLLSNNETKTQFFRDIDGVMVFDKVGFGWVVNNRQFLPDSYTRFKNKIGLTDESGELLSRSGNVELIFPYKDCVLEGGQTKEEVKRKEVFYNTTLAPNEVDRLLFPKVFCNAKRYDANGITDTTELLCDDNLIIKGNNLLTLSSLLKRYEGRVKCIYIDPPYYFVANKDEDTFDYNSNFKLSTWLVFMKNRLEIAYRLLSNDGAIFVQISDDGVAELHCLLKEIFCKNGENNFINKITVKTKSPSGFASVNPGVFETAEYILAFAKNKKSWKYNTQYVESQYDTNYKWYIENETEDCSKWIISDVFEHVAKVKGYSDKKAAVKELGSTVFNELVGEFALTHADSVFRYTAIGDNAGQEIIAIREKSKIDKDMIFMVERDNHYNVFIKNGSEIAFYSKKIREIDGKKVPSIQLSNIWTDTPYEGIAKEGNVTLKGGKKPEKLLKRIIEMATDEGDLVMDFHLGSGTTCAVAHKLGRQYIGVEQLDSQMKKILTRLPEVISGDQSGISKSAGWTGGGSFVYCELAKANQKYIDELQGLSSKEAIKELYERIIGTGFISCNVDLKKVSESASEFDDLSIDEQKQFIMELMDMNLLYINYCDIDDDEFAISEDDKKFTKSVYRRE